MDVALILADAARIHPDNTFSLLRGGITVVNVPRNAPILYKGALLARVTGTPAEAGTHEILIVCIDEDGGRVGREITGGFEIPEKGGSVQVAVHMNMILPKHGSYELVVTVDEREMASWSLETREAAPELGLARDNATGATVAAVQLRGSQDLPGSGFCAELVVAPTIRTRRTRHGRPLYTEEDMIRMDCPYPPDSDL